MTEQQREEFEKFAAEWFLDTTRRGATYRDIETRSAWEGWKASREYFFKYRVPAAFMIKVGENKTVLTTSLTEAHEIAERHGGVVRCLYEQEKL